MALPPIIANLPITKVLSGAQDKQEKDVAEQSAQSASGTQDTVTLSEAALKKLDELKSEGINTPDKARQVSIDVRDTLAENPDLTLGGQA